MKNHTMYSSLLGLLLVAFSAPYMSAEKSSCAPMVEVGEQDKKAPHHECANELELHKLCAKKVKAHCVDTRQLSSRKVCTNKLYAESACIKELNDFAHICASSLDAIDANIMNLNTNDLCVSGTLQANSIQQCKPYRATAILSGNTTYTLGNPVPFNVILDDPNGDTSIAPFFTYTAPVEGYYIVTFQFDVINILPTFPNPVILGTPVSHPAVLVNGQIFRESNIPFLTFNSAQQANIAGLISLAAGDVVTVTYDVLTVDPVLGFQNVVGTIVAEGNGVTENKSLFKIQHLSSLCNPGPCPVVTVCNPATCDIDCSPCC